MSDSRRQWDEPSRRAASPDDTPWTSAEMPCVYCGQMVPREVDRCPHCRTSYSLAVRRASREIEGQWFYLEPRNPSNRGVDFSTMLKLIEKGRLRASSVVRGPTTQQDWMYAAETPLLSKHLGVCPHCYHPAEPEQEFCETCHRELDARPGRLRPGVSEAGAPSLFPDRDAVEDQLAEALKTHELSMAASEVAAEEESRAIDRLLAQEPGGDSRTQVVARPARPKVRRRPKPLVVVLLTVVTVIPLGLLMIILPLEIVMPGDSAEPGTIAHRVRNNRRSVLRTFGWVSDDDSADVSKNPQVRRLTEQAEAALAAGNLYEALNVYNQLLAQYPSSSTAESWQAKIRDIRRRVTDEREKQRLLEVVRAVEKAVAGDDYRRAETLLKGLKDDERDLLVQAGVNLRMLEAQVSAALQGQQEKQRGERLKQEVRDLLAQALRQAQAKDYAGAVATYEVIRNKYPAEYLPAGVSLDDLISQAKAGGVPSKPPPPPQDTVQLQADGLWREILRLEAAKDFIAAEAKCQELQALDKKYHPAELAEKSKYLKQKADEQRKEIFFGRQDEAPKPPAPAPAPVPTPQPPKEATQAKADSLWRDILKLETDQKFIEAFAKCQELQALPEQFYPQGFKEKFEHLKQKAEEQKQNFFGR